MSDRLEFFEAKLVSPHAVIVNREWGDVLVIWDDPDGSLKFQVDDDEEKRCIFLQTLRRNRRHELAEFILGRKIEEEA